MIYTKQEWYTPAEVAIHNRASDCWVSVNGVVRNLTSWLQEQFKVCKCTKSCSCPVKNWFCEDTCVEHCNCFKRGFTYCDGKRVKINFFTKKAILTFFLLVSYKSSNSLADSKYVLYKARNIFQFRFSRSLRLLLQPNLKKAIF